MEVILTSLIGIIIFLGYSLHLNGSENLRLKNFLREKEFDIQNLSDEKDKEISNLKRQFQTEKNRLIQSPNKNLDETLKLRKELNDRKNEILDLQRKLRENEKIISDLRNINSSLNLKSENEIQSLRRQLSATKNESNEIYLLRNKISDLQSDIQFLNENSNSLRNENNRLKSKIKNLERNQPNEMSLFDEDFSNPKPKTSKRFVQVVFKGFSDKKRDYYLGNHRNIKVGDFVMVGTKNGAKRAKVVYISEPGEFSIHANSEIIKKIE